MSHLQFVAWGQPVGQGSITRNRYGAAYNAAKGAGPWRKEVIRAATDAAGPDWVILEEATLVDVTFYGPRSSSHYGTGRNAGILKASAPTYPIAQGRYGAGLQDIDKLARSILDALKIAGIIRDDSIVTDLNCRARYAEQPTGARALVTVHPQAAIA